jgi:hypothetical protein
LEVKNDMGEVLRRGLGKDILREGTEARHGRKRKQATQSKASAVFCEQFLEKSLRN